MTHSPNLSDNGPAPIYNGPSESCPGHYNSIQNFKRSKKAIIFGNILYEAVELVTGNDWSEQYLLRISQKHLFSGRPMSLKIEESKRHLLATSRRYYLELSWVNHGAQENVLQRSEHMEFVEFWIKNYLPRSLWLYTGHLSLPYSGNSAPRTFLRLVRLNWLIDCFGHVMQEMSCGWSSTVSCSVSRGLQKSAHWVLLTERFA